MAHWESRNRLEKLELAARNRNEEDRGHFTVVLTRQGEELLEDVFPGPCEKDCRGNVTRDALNKFN